MSFAPTDASHSGVVLRLAEQRSFGCGLRRAASFRLFLGKRLGRTLAWPREPRFSLVSLVSLVWR
jgi:hypothetical protein